MASLSWFSVHYGNKERKNCDMGRFPCDKDWRNFALFGMRLSAIKARRKGLKAAFWAFTRLIINHLARFLLKKRLSVALGRFFSSSCVLF